MGFLGGLMDGFSLSADFQTGHANKYEVSAYDAYTKKQAVVTAGFIDNVFDDLLKDLDGAFAALNVQTQGNKVGLIIMGVVLLAIGMFGAWYTIQYFREGKNKLKSRSVRNVPLSVVVDHSGEKPKIAQDQGWPEVD